MSYSSEQRPMAHSPLFDHGNIPDCGQCDSTEIHSQPEKPPARRLPLSTANISQSTVNVSQDLFEGPMVSRTSGDPFLEGSSTDPLRRKSGQMTEFPALSQRSSKRSRLDESSESFSDGYIESHSDDESGSYLDDSSGSFIPEPEPASKRRRNTKTRTLIGNTIQGDSVAFRVPSSGVIETGPSAPRNYLKDSVPEEIKRLLKEWFKTKCDHDNSIIDKFTMSSIKNVYQRQDPRHPDRTVARYTDADNRILEIKPYLLQNVLQELAQFPKRWILVARNANHGPWIVTFKRTIPNGCFYRIWLGYEGHENGLSVLKTWIDPESYHTQPASRSINRSIRPPQPSSVVEAAPYPLPDGDEIPASLVRDIQQYIQRYGRDREIAIKELTNTNTKFLTRKDGQSAVFESCVDGSPLRGISVSTADVRFLRLEEGRQRILNVVVDSSKKGYVVRHDGRNTGGDGVTFYQKWYLDSGFESKPSVRKVGKLRSRAHGAESHAMDAPENRPPSDANEEFSNVIHVAQNHADPLRTCANPIQCSYRGIPANEAPSTFSTRPTHLDAEGERIRRMNFNNNNVALQNSMLAHSSQGSSHPLPCAKEPRLVFRFYRSSKRAANPDYIDVEFQGGVDLSRFGMRLAKSGMFTSQEIRAGRFRLSVSIETCPDFEFLLDGMQRDEVDSEYREMICLIEDVRREVRTREVLIVNIERWA